MKSVCPSWWIVEKASSDGLYFQFCVCVSDAVWPFLFLQMNQRFAPLSCHALLLFAEQITFFVVTLKMWKIEVLLYLPSSEIDYKPSYFPSLKEKYTKSQ